MVRWGAVSRWGDGDRVQSMKREGEGVVGSPADCDGSSARGKGVNEAVHEVVTVRTEETDVAERRVQAKKTLRR